MGDIADMMLDGLMCEGCGIFMDDGEECGYPRRCGACSAEYRRGENIARVKVKEVKPVPCSNCKRRFGTPEAYLQHWKDKHEKETKHV